MFLESLYTKKNLEIFNARQVLLTIYCSLNNYIKYSWGSCSSVPHKNANILIFNDKIETLVSYSEFEKVIKYSSVENYNEERLLDPIKITEKHFDSDFFHLNQESSRFEIPVELFFRTENLFSSSCRLG